MNRSARRSRIAFACLLHAAIARGQSPEPAPPPSTLAPSTTTQTTLPTAGLKIIRPNTPDDILARRRDLPERMPTHRGFIAPIIDEANQPWHPVLDPQLPPDLQQVADIINRRLAREGLLTTLARCLESLIEASGPRRLTQDRDRIVSDLQRAGFPIDLLRHFPPDGDESAEPWQVIMNIARRFSTGRTADDLLPELQTWPMHWRKSNPDFTVATESGEHTIDTIRFQVAAGSYYQGPGDGSNLDVLRQLVEALPQTTFLVSVAENHLDSMLTTMNSWPHGFAERMSLFVEPYTVSQWTQDNAKSGFIKTEAGLTPTLLVPRYASRREEYAVFVPGDSFLLETLAFNGVSVVHSPLLFQGGDLLAVKDPVKKETVLLLGEANVHRNVALGLSPAQVVEAFAIEFGVPRCLVLPAPSYHLDYEVTFRVVNQQLVAFVNDTMAANVLILKVGLEAMQRAGLFEQEKYRMASEHLAAGRVDDALAVLEGILEKHSVDYGRFPLSFSRQFQVGSSDSGVGNLQRFLLAVDFVAFGRDDAPWIPPEPYGLAYARSLRRREKDRVALRQMLSDQGWKVVPVPSTSEGDRSLNYLNDIHAQEMMLLTVYGGLFEGMDQVMQEFFASFLSSRVRIVPILCGESQRRHGAVHCSVGVIPSPPGK